MYPSQFSPKWPIYDVTKSLVCKKVIQITRLNNWFLYYERRMLTINWKSYTAVWKERRLAFPFKIMEEAYRSGWREYRQSIAIYFVASRHGFCHLFLRLQPFGDPNTNQNAFTAFPSLVPWFTLISLSTTYSKEEFLKEKMGTNIRLTDFDIALSKTLG